MAPQNQPPGTPVSRVPPSTMAAQLINNLSIKRPSRQIEHDELHSLMNEVSMQENDISSLTDEKDIVKHKHKLVYVITRVVWERLEKKDIFTDLTTVIDQACEALDVFISTIEDVPDVLNFSAPNDLSLTARGPEPLWLWLFPRILSFLGRQAYDKLTEKISTFFFTAFEAVSKSPRLWKLTSSFFCYLVDSVSTILSHLHSSNLASHVQEIHFVLPSDHFDLSTYCDDQKGSFDQSSPCNYMLRDVTDALRHATCILTILVNISNQAASTQDASLTFQNHLAWLLDSFYSSHELQKIWPIHDTSQPDGIAPSTALYYATQSLFVSIRATIPDSLLCKGYFYLAIIGADILDDPSILADKDVNLRFCHMLLHLALICRRHNAVGQVTGLCLVPKLQIILENEDTIAIVGNDFKNAASALKWACGPATTGILEPNRYYRSFEEESLNVDFGLMMVVHQPPGTDHTVYAPPSKRRKLSTNGVLEEITKNLYLLLVNQEATDLDGLSQQAVTCFASLDESGRSQAIKYLSMIPCAAYGSLVVTRDPAGNITHSRCFFCEKLPPPEGKTVHNARCQSVSKEAISILTTLVKSPIFHDSKRSRVLAMIALRTFATHFTDNEFLDLEASSLGQWCLQSLQSSVRELRIAAGRALPQFLEGPEVPQGLLQKNRTNVLIILRDLCEKPALYLQETCVLAWGQLGRLLEDGELNIVLLKLVEYLGHSNPIVSNAAYNEILKLAKSNGTFDKPVERMFTPFWESVAIAAVKDLLVRPQTTQLMADLLEMTVPDFLILTQAYTLPWLVLWGEVKIIKKIAQARNEDPGRVCIDDANVFRIMALLLVQDVHDIESHTMSKLKCISPEFDKQGLTFAHLLKIGPPNTFLQLLIVAGDADDSKKSRIYHALKFLVEGVQSSENTRKGQSHMATFMEQHNLGLITRISEVVNDSRDEQNTYEKKRHVRAIEEMIKIAKTYTRSARPQICACLQSALAQKPLQASAFSAWAAMLRYLDDEDVEIMLESTFSTIIQCWDSFDELTKNAAEGVLKYLVAERGRTIRNKIVDLPSLSQFPQLAEVESKLKKFRSPTDVSNTFQIFSRRIQHENAGVVAQALSELKVFLQSHQSYLQASAVSEQPDVVVGRLVRSILDACVKFNESHHDIADLTGACIGLIGCLDPNRVEAVREQREMVVVANFEDPNETTDFVLFILEEVVVNAFLSATDTNLQGFLSYVMQELLERGGFKDVCVPILRSNKRTSTDLLYQKWISLPENVQATLTPFLTSKFSVTEMKVPPTRYPIFQPDNAAADRSNKYNNWLKAFVLDLLQRPKNPNAELIFAPLRRAVRIKDLSVASFLLPYLVLHVVIKGEESERSMIAEELFGVLSYSHHSQSRIKYEELRLCSEAVFRVLDYLSRWIQAKQLASSKLRGQDQVEAENQVRKVTTLLESIPAKIVSNRAIQCRSYARALFYWEQHIRHAREKERNELQETRDMERLQEIYTQIDEPDGIEGISAHLHVLDIDQIILGHRKAGRWTAAQSWYEIKLADDPEDSDVQINLLTCLKASGQHDVLLNYVEGMLGNIDTMGKLLPFATEASWATERWLSLKKYTEMATSEAGEDFNVSVGKALLALRQDPAEFTSSVRGLRRQIACSLSRSTTSSIGSFHDSMLKFHVLTELEMIAGTDSDEEIPRHQLIESLDRRLETIGAYLNDKQYLLGIRRAAMQRSSLQFAKESIASSWLTSARLARKGNAIHQSFNAVLHASKLGDDSAKIEHARLLWKEDQHRKAIQSLQGAIDSNAFISHNEMIKANVTVTDGSHQDQEKQQNLLEARAHLLLAKWLDIAGQTNSTALRAQYQHAVRTHSGWEKTHYYLGRHYNNLLESQKNLPPDRQDETYLSGEMATLVIANYLRSLTHGTKYVYQTLPRILTLWLDLGSQVNQKLDPKYGNSQEFVSRVTKVRKSHLDALHARFKKYIPKMPAYIFYTALPQIVSRITHPNKEVNTYLQTIIYKVVSSHPQQSLWSLLAISTSTQKDRRMKGAEVLSKLISDAPKVAGSGSLDMKALIKNGQNLTAEILKVCEVGDFPGQKTYRASITKDLQFQHKHTPSLLAVPIEAALTATLPTLTDKVATHKAFSRDVITINGFEDEVLVLNSLAKPRRLTALGSNGQLYGLLCKPKDDLRKDQRLMEFNGMINRSLKRDAESSRRQLYIRTYAVTPLNEECGIIEWVDGLKTFRDILLNLYKPRGIHINYSEIAAYCEEAIKNDTKLPFFTEKVLGMFPPVFHHWFVQQFPEPSAWFAARLRYTRSCAVMSMVGTILGLGDRHTENILFEEGNGGTFHVDFNCLFDKGLTFAKPERVPFRLTHNMIDAMGMYGYEGPFRKSAELTLKLLRQHEETLMTILEAFVYDPTLDLMKKSDKDRKRRGDGHAVDGTQSAQSVLDAIGRKVRGLLVGESVPLSVEGHVDELIKQATEPKHLAAMYIGWCSFF